MSDNQLQRRPANAVKEKGQYLLAFGVVGSMLLVAGFPVFVVFFFGIFAYFLFRIFTSGSKNETREIFEFYLTANEILRDDGRNWFGFEVRDAVGRGESIVNRMTNAPPLVYFALGALYNKAGDHQSAINALTRVIETDGGTEEAYVYPTQELRNYVKVLRKIEREPAEAPLTSASIRALERARRLRGRTLLEESRAAYVKNASQNPRPELSQKRDDGEATFQSASNATSGTIIDRMTDHEATPAPQPATQSDARTRSDSGTRDRKDPFADRKPISEVLHDIYDKNVQ